MLLNAIKSVPAIRTDVLPIVCMIFGRQNERNNDDIGKTPKIQPIITEGTPCLRATAG